MRFLLLSSAVGLGLTVLAPCARAQHPDSVAVAGAVQRLTSDLRNYVVAQEKYYADHNTYAGTAQAAELTPSTGATVVVLTSSSHGHNAVAIDQRVPGLVCAVWVGREPAPPLGDGAKEGQPTCRVPS